jgi:glycosyltransferase involved in cell wall biosynthesis
MLVFAAYFHPHVGGHEKIVYELSRRLVQKGYQIDILTCNTERTLAYEELDGIHIYRLPCWNALNSTYPVPRPCPTSFRILCRLLRKDYDVINTQTRFFVTSFLGLIFAKLKRTPFVHTEHGTRHTIVRAEVMDLISRAYDHSIGTLVVKSARRNIGVSEAACEFLRHLGATNIQLEHNGIDIDVFKKKEDPDCRDKLGISNGAVVVTFVGRLIYAKGVQDLIVAFSRTKTIALDTKLLIVGDGPHRVTLEALGHQTICEDDILFLGQKNQAELIEILSATDIFVNPSYSEGLPTCVMEAASIGLPVIATDVGGTREVIVDHQTGLLIKPADTAQLAQKLRELLSNTELRRDLGANARIFVEQGFGWDKIIQDWPRILDELR